MNMDVFLISLEFSMIKNTVSYTNNRWNDLNDAQKEHVQSKLSCCGFNDKNDRSVKKCNNIGCKDIFIGIVEGVRRKSIRFFIFIFMIKSLGLAFGGILNSRKKKEKKKKSRKIAEFKRIEIT